MNFNFSIYVVSLESDVDKRNRLSKLYPKYFNQFKFFNAIDGRALLAKDYYNQILPEFFLRRRLMSPSEVGCSLSHLQVLKKFQNSSDDFAIILEDDILGTDADLEKIVHIAKSFLEINDDFVFIAGGQEGLAARKYLYGKNVFIQDEVQNDVWSLAAFSVHHVLRTCCYVVTKKSSASIIKYQSNSLTVADFWSLFFVGKSTSFFYSKILRHPLDLKDSVIEKERQKKKPRKDVFILTKMFVLKMYRLFMVFLLLISGYKKIDA